MNKYKNTILHTESQSNQQPHCSNHKQSNKDAPTINNLVNNANPTIVMASAKVKKMNSKHVFLIYSRIHNKLRLRFSTLFKAIALFKVYEQWSSPTKQQIPEQYAIIVCLNISLKYEQIYPPKLRKILPFLKLNSISISQYWKYQLMFIQLLQADLNLPTAKIIVDSYLPNQQKAVYWHAYYLLQLSLMDQRLIGFTLQEICLGVVSIMVKLGDTLKNKKRLEEGEGINEQRVNYCSRVILKSKYKATQNESVIYKKYSQDSYEKVSQKVIYCQCN